VFVISNRPRASHSSDFEITRAISPWIVLRSVELLLYVLSLLRTQTHTPCHASSTRQVIKWTMIGQMAIAIALLGFNDLGRSVIPIFLLMVHFLYRFSTLSKKWRKSIDHKFEFFCKMHHQIPFFLTLCLSVRRFEMPLGGLRFVKTFAT